jgi:hypothetical protein
MSALRWFAPLLLPLLAGCGGYVALEVDSDPQGARVYMDGELVGQTPTGVITRHVSEDTFSVTLELLNYKPKALYVTTGTTHGTPEEAEAENLRRYSFTLDPRF